MSGLKLVPRIPKWPSLTKAIEAPISAATPTGKPSRAATSRPSTRFHRYASEAITATSTASAEIVPSPGSRTVAQQSAASSASPIAGALHDQRRRPQIASPAWPIASEAMLTARNEA